MRMSMRRFTRMTPAIKAGITKWSWSLADLLEAAVA